MTEQEEREQIEYYTSCRMIFDHYGEKNQRKQLIQELAELIQAVTKNNEENFIEELADVQVMIDQFLITDPELDEKFQKLQLLKIRRQVQRIDEEKING